MRLIYLLLLAWGISLTTPAAALAAPDARQRTREWVMSHARNNFSGIEPEDNDQAQDLVERLVYRNLAAMEAAGLLKAGLAESPWTDSYWPTYAGQIANRYADPDYNAAMTWSYNRDYLTEHLGQGSADLLSPAEKYDLLVGDAGFTLTNQMIRTGAPFDEQFGLVETWMGLCHGWAPASMMLPRPARAVKVRIADGRELTFTPSDLKALATLLWASAPGQTRFVGGRCNTREPDRDGTLRPTDPDCFDTNPATWHLAVVNQIGVAQRSFVIDASSGFDVSNQPVQGYQYAYINPNTGESSLELARSKVALSEVKNDPFAKHRSPRAEFLVKIIMSVRYVTENTPSKRLTDAPENDTFGVITYSYDLELDSSDNIVGGEWHSSLHPDFLWVPVPGAAAYSVGDAWLDTWGDPAVWDGEGTVPASWSRAARGASRQDQPLARIVTKLLERAR